MELLDANGLKGLYDFIYVPQDFKRLPVLANIGYFFTNFVTHDVALRAWQKLDGFKAWEPESPKVLAPCWATRTQGLKACIESYRNSPVMHQDIPIECKPLVIENGKIIQLTPTRRRVRPPRFKTLTPRVDQNYRGHDTAGGYGQLTASALESACEGSSHIKDSNSEGDEVGMTGSTFSTTAGSSEGDEVYPSFPSNLSKLA